MKYQSANSLISVLLAANLSPLIFHQPCLKCRAVRPPCPRCTPSCLPHGELEDWFSGAGDFISCFRSQLDFAWVSPGMSHCLRGDFWEESKFSERMPCHPAQGLRALRIRPWSGLVGPFTMWRLCLTQTGWGGWLSRVL